MHRITYEPEKFQLTIASYTRGATRIEIVVDPDQALALREGKDVDLDDVLKAPYIFADAQKGMHASPQELQHVFGDLKEEDIFRKILTEGEIHYTANYLKQKREAMERQIVTYIHNNAIDPTTGLLHPLTRIENAFEHIKLRIDPFLPARKQAETILPELKKILPIRIATMKIQVHVPANFAAKVHGKLLSYGTKESDRWMNDGSLLFIVRVSPGEFEQLREYVNKATHGSAHIEEVSQS